MTDVTRNARRVLKDPFRANSNLTDRERKVAMLAAQNLTGLEIAETLGISTATAAIDLRLAMVKIGVKRKRDLTTLVIDRMIKAITGEV